MNWIRAFLELNKSLFLKGLLLLMAFLLGLQMGQFRLQRRWDAEKQTLQIAQAKQEQHAVDAAQVKNKISKEISDDYRKKSSLLSGNAVAERMFDKPQISAGNLSAVSINAARVASASANDVSATEDVSELMSCTRLRNDATQTTLMLLEIQRWYQKQKEIEP